MASAAPAPESGASRPQEVFFYGGQAVVEGVMMRGPADYAVAVRRSDGGIEVRREHLSAPIYVGRLWRLPFLRALAVMAEQLHLGLKSLAWAASVSAGEEADFRFGRREMAVSVVGGVLVAVGLFIGLPLLGASIAVHRSGSAWFTLAEGVLRAALVLGYLALIALIPDVRRLFQYHAAEHKTINAFEAGSPLEVVEVRRASRLHPRCGTGFVVVVLIVSVVVFSLFSFLHLDWIAVVASRLVGLPVVVALSYEAVRWLARHQRHPLSRIALQPVLWTQLLTTREPDDSMLEVGIAALTAVREAEARAA